MKFHTNTKQKLKDNFLYFNPEASGSIHMPQGFAKCAIRL
jgi:hypothetical protein